MLRGVKIIQGRINLHTDASVLSSAGKGFTVAKTTTGIYTVTLGRTGKLDRYNFLMGCGLTKLEATASVLMPMLQSEAVNSATPTIVIKTAAPATGVAADTSVAMSIFFSFHLQNHSGS